MVSAKKVEWADPASKEESRGFSAVSVEEYRGDEAAAQRIIEITHEVGWGKYYGSPADYAAAFRGTERPSGRKIYLAKVGPAIVRSEEHTSELQSLRHLVCRPLH